MQTRKVYLAGAIFGLADRGQCWREQAIRLLPLDWKAVNPNLVELDKITPADLIAGDYAAIRECAAIIVRCRQPSWGTAMELAYAKLVGVPVIGFPFYRPPVAPNYSPWLIHHVTIFTTTVEEAIMRLRDV